MVGSPVLSALLLSFTSPALARGPAACVAPTQRLPGDRMTVVTAAVESRVAALGGSAGASTATSTDTVLLSQDALARSWYIYQLCLQADSGLLSAGEYGAQLRFVLGMAPADAAHPGESSPDNGAEGQADPAALVGTWVVTATERRSTCTRPVASPEVNRYLWVVGASGTGTVSVAVDGGSTRFRSYTGVLVGQDLRLDAVDQDAHSTFFLRVDGPSLAGDRVVSVVVGGVACTVEFLVGGVRQ